MEDWLTCSSLKLHGIALSSLKLQFLIYMTLSLKKSIFADFEVTLLLPLLEALTKPIFSHCSFDHILTLVQYVWPCGSRFKGHKNTRKSAWTEQDTIRQYLFSRGHYLLITGESFATWWWKPFSLGLDEAIARFWKLENGFFKILTPSNFSWKESRQLRPIWNFLLGSLSSLTMKNVDAIELNGPHSSFALFLDLGIFPFRWVFGVGLAG